MKMCSTEGTSSSSSPSSPYSNMDQFLLGNEENTSILIQFINCRLLRNHKIINEDLWVRDGKIIDPEKIFFDEKIVADIKINCNNVIIAPGFIELQINGGFGIDFSQDISSVEEGINTVAKGLLEQGVTSFCPTIVTSPSTVYSKVIPKIKRKKGDENGATILGIHLEGPFINVKKKGAHPPQYIKDLDNGFETLKDVYSTIENVSIVTLAPEKTGSCEVIKKLKNCNITVSLGHSDGNLSDGEQAVKCGASLITHLFNAMLPFHHRDPGLVGLLTSDQIPANQKIFFGIIADGVHTHPAALRIAYRTHPDGLILVTDAISAMGLPEGLHQLGQHDIEVKNGKAFVSGTDTLCGSIATMDECIRIFQKATNCTKEYAIEAASLHPAECLGISSLKGTLNYGADADFVFLNDDLNVISTWISGLCVHFNEKYAKNVPHLNRTTE